MRGVDPTAVHAIDGSLHTGTLADAQIPAAITRDAEWSAIDFLTATAQAALSAERTLAPSTVMSGLGWELRKTTNQTFNNTITLATIGGLSFTVPTGVSIAIHLLLRISTSAVADIRLFWSLPAGAAFRGNIVSDNQAFRAWDGSELAFGGGAANEVFSIEGVLTIGVNGGTAALQGAQGTAEVSDTIFQADSFMAVYRTA